MSSLQAAYFIHGEEELLRLEAIDKIRSTARECDFADRQVFTVEAGFDWADLLLEIQSVGLFADQKLIEINLLSGKPGKEGGDILLKIIQNLPEAICIVLIAPKLDRTQTQSKWFAAWSKVATVIETKAITAAMLPQWIKNRLAKYHFSIEADALSLFAEKVEGNLLAASQEIDKLALLFSPPYSITLADAENVIANVARFDIFQLSRAWMTGDISRLSRLMNGLSETEAEPVLLLWAISEDIRILLKLLAAIKQKQNISDLRHSLRLWGDKQILASQAAQRIGASRLLASLQTCARIDRQIKGAQEGNAWQETKNLLLSLAS